jgi:hypothetical protein
MSYAQIPVDPKQLFPKTLLQKVPYAFLPFPIRATCQTHRSLLHFTIPVIRDDLYKWRNCCQSNKQHNTRSHMFRIVTELGILHSIMLGFMHVFVTSLLREAAVGVNARLLRLFCFPQDSKCRAHVWPM